MADKNSPRSYQTLDKNHDTDKTDFMYRQFKKTAHIIKLSYRRKQFYCVKLCKLDILPQFFSNGATSYMYLHGFFLDLNKMCVRNAGKRRTLSNAFKYLILREHFLYTFYSSASLTSLVSLTCIGSITFFKTECL